MAQENNIAKIAGNAAEQTREVTENYFSWLEKMMSASPWSGTELGEKLKSYTEKNIAATNDYVQKLSSAKQFPDIIRIQTEYMQMQMNAFAEQAKTLSESFTKLATGVIKPPF